MARFEGEDRIRHRRIRLNKDLAKFEKLKAFRVTQEARLARWEEERQQRIDLGLWADDRAEGVWDVTVVQVESLISEKTAEVKSTKAK